MISWVNPGAELADKGFSDYLLEGPLAALDAIKRATGEAEANVIGYCIGGTLTASALAYMAATRRQTRSLRHVFHDPSRLYRCGRHLGIH